MTLQLVETHTAQSFLASGAAWPNEPPPQVIETHCALVFLTRDRVWKMKKSIRLPFLDFTSLDARETACREEFRLNRALAGDVYRRVVALTTTSDGKIMLGGRGTPIEWLVEMRRLPSDQLLDNRLRAGNPPDTKTIGQVATRLLQFYKHAPRPRGSGPSYMRRWMREGRINALHLEEMRHHFGPNFSPALSIAAMDLIDASRNEIDERGRLGLILEGHGDLRPEHICLEDPPIIFDRLEFDPLLRLADPFDEFNYLGLECAGMGAPWIGDVLLSRLHQAGLPSPSPRLLAAYGINRCLSRARLAIDHLREPGMRTPQKWPRQARAYIARAQELLDGLS